MGKSLDWSSKGNRVEYQVSIVSHDQSNGKSRHLPDTLRDSLAQLDQIYRTAPVGMCLVDTELRYVRVNQLLADINSVPIEDHIGKTIAEVIPKLAAYIEPAFREVLDTGEPITNVEIQSTTPQDDSNPKQWVVNYYPFIDSDDEIRGVSVTVQDVTELKNSQRVSEEAFLEGLLQGQERERSRLARELHDSVAQNVAAMIVHIALLEGNLTEQSEESIKKLSDLAESTSEMLRRIALDLHPFELEELGLETALNQFITVLHKESSAELTLHVEGDAYKVLLSENLALTAYRVCQEAITNAIKHGQPAHVDVKIIWEPHLLTLLIDDDGIGFDINEMEKTSLGFGLMTMRERAHLAKGSFIIGSRAGGGIAIRLELPLPNPNTRTVDPDIIIIESV